MIELTSKLLPRNVAAMRAGARPYDVPVLVAGNAASSLPESGVGNCFPGLECDLRNLERRFFPFLEIDSNFEELIVASVDHAGVTRSAAAGDLTQAQKQVYLAINSGIQASERWTIVRLAGNFGPLGMLDFAMADLSVGRFAPDKLPSDSWTAVRLLKENEIVTLTVKAPNGTSHVLLGRRTRYLDPNGALSNIFEVGELTQSLCSPWTHDFRDCGCYYWASNHPDIALPVDRGISTVPDLATPWLRSDRSVANPPVATVRPNIPEIAHHGINRDWQLLNFVIERREQVVPNAERLAKATALSDLPTLLVHLNYAAGVELAVMQEYLVAAWSLKLAAPEQEPLRGDLRASFSELLRIAIGEMRHLRAVNDVLRIVSPQGTYAPALRVAAELPAGQGNWRSRSFQALTPAALTEFIDIEAPSQTVDSLYGQILATLEAMGNAAEAAQAIRTVMAEGEDHWQTFLFIQEWLAPHDPASYLRATAPSTAPLPAQQLLTTRFLSLLDQLYTGYAAGMPAGATSVNSARVSMLGANGIEGALEAVAAGGFLPVFETVADPRFVELAHP